MNASTARGRRSARAGLVTAVLLMVVAGLVPAGAVPAGAAAESKIEDSALPGRIVTAWGPSIHGRMRVPAGLSGVTAVVAGRRRSLALRSNGKVTSYE